MDLIALNRVKDSQWIVLENSLEVNLILGMDWLAKNHANINCCKKKMVFMSPSKIRFKFRVRVGDYA